MVLPIELIHDKDAVAPVLHDGDNQLAKRIQGTDQAPDVAKIVEDRVDVSFVLQFGEREFKSDRILEGVLVGHRPCAVVLEAETPRNFLLQLGHVEWLIASLDV